MRASLIVLAVLLAPWTFLPSSPAQPPPDQDWVIDRDTVLSYEVFYLDHDLIVRSGARLEMHDVELHFESPTSQYLSFVLEQGATLEMRDCQINQPGTQEACAFESHGSNITMERCELYEISGGLELDGSSLKMGNCTVSSLYYTGSCTITCSQGSLDVAQSLLTGYYYGVVADRCSVVMAGSIVESNELALRTQYCEVSVSDCALASYYEPSARIHFGNASFAGCSFGDYYSGRSGGREGSSAPAPPPAPGLLVEGCSFGNCTYGCRVGYEQTNSPGLGLYDFMKASVRDCTFEYLGIGIEASGFAGNASFEDCRFHDSYYAYTHLRLNNIANCSVRNCSFEDADGLYVSNGFLTAEDNRFTLAYGGDEAISVYGYANVRRNSFSIRPGVSGRRGMGVSLNHGSDGRQCDVSGNFFDGLDTPVSIDDSIHYQNPPRLTLLDNRVTNSTRGLHCYGAGCDMSFNRLNVTQDALSCYDTDHPVSISGNIIEGSQTGITLYATAGTVSGNDVVSSQAGMLINGEGNTLEGLRIEDNRISSPGRGIYIIEAVVSGGNGSVSNNTVRDARYGIDIESSNMPVEDNRLENISAYGLYQLDHAGRLSGNEYTFAPGDPANASRVGRFWSVQVTPMYNRRPPGEPSEWEQNNWCNLKATDGTGALAINETYFYNYEKTVVKDTIIWADGCETSYNPYRLMASIPGKGAVSLVKNITAPFSERLYLNKGPDLVPLSINISEDFPEEGDLVVLTGQVLNDPSHDPDAVSARNSVLALKVDGELVSELLVHSIPSGRSAYISALWVASAGWHDITLSADTGQAIPEVFEHDNELTLPFRVMPRPRGYLRVERPLYEVEEAVNFTVEIAPGTPDMAGYRLDFGDGSSSSWSPSPSTTHVYLLPGKYLARAWMATAEGSVRECDEPVLVNITYGTPALQPFATPETSFSGTDVLFRVSSSSGLENITAHTWDFGDGHYSFGGNDFTTSHAYARPGKYSVLLSLVFDDGTTREYSLEYDVWNRAPRAAPRLSPEKGTVAVNFTFTSNSTDADGELAEFHWDFGDGNSSWEQTAFHRYAAKGTYKAKLSVKDEWGAWSTSANLTVVVENSPPVPDFTVRGNPARAGEELTFDASATLDPDDPAGALNFSWLFGDGTSGSGREVKHAYGEAGAYVVTLSVGDGAGAPSVTTLRVTILERAQVGIGWQLPVAALAGGLLGALAVLALFSRKKPPGSALPKPARPAGEERPPGKDAPPSVERREEE